MSFLVPKPIQKADANPSFERLLDSEEASHLKIHPKTLQKMASSGEIAKAFRWQAIMFPRFGLKSWLNRMRYCGSSFLIWLD